MKKAAGLCMAAVALLSVAPFVPGGIFSNPHDKHLLDQVNQRIAGRIVDYTHNHGQDLRVFSNALQRLQDLYVYLPPDYDASKRYPIVILLHGVLEDERGFLKHGVDQLDAAIACGQLPPLIIAVPDGSLDDQPHLFRPGSFFINGPNGPYQDWIVNDLWEFMTTHYPIRTERAAHVIAGASMGGFGAFNIGIKHRDRFQIVMGILPALNLRWVDCHGNYRAKFDPLNWGWRETPADPHELVGTFELGLIKVRVKHLIIPAFGAGWEGLIKASEENPIELVDRLNLKNGELDMYVGYAGRDEFNLDTQAESFLYLCKARGIDVTSYYDPTGTHSVETAKRMAPDIVDWLNKRLREHHIDGPVNQ